MDQDRKFAEMNGLCWHEFNVIGEMGSIPKCKCGILEPDGNPDFSDPREVLKVVMERGDCYRFIATLNGLSLDEDGDFIDYAIPIYCITTPGKLRDAWITWKEAQK
jgi:hypothetical protein